ncbi:VOC family protein [Antrihabitans cavernicola]|uniref:VOC family protein n=1 Tax=Antrihabitans cavernicola TaxID=2495913 RepID=A0A5A7S7F1_9NOCA|nr:VOC family protein [Spelaeibacter cavernicola]KAA0018921.1 VOC family protein [Spelaeibacter cavernicola]
MSLQWEAIVVNALDPDALGRWWAAALGWETGLDEDGDLTVVSPSDSAPDLLFATVPESKAGPNRLHLDFRPDDQAAEVQRLPNLGATHTDVGQGEQTWVVLADPEGNEFCVPSARP